MKVEIYGADWCSSCKTAADICKNNNIDYSYINIDESTNLKDLEDRMGIKVRSIPQIFIDGAYVSNGINELNKRIK